MANILTQQYKSVFTTPKDIPDVLLKQPKNGNSLSEITISDKDIKEAINNMAIMSALGPDGITASIYKEYADQLIYSKKKIWEASLESVKLPEGAAQTIITPIYKDGMKSNLANYWPVALTNDLPKIFEKILKKSMVEYLESNEVMNPAQHVFRHKRSTISQMLSFYEDISKLENRDDVDVIYLDFSKVFDRKDHTILLHIIKALDSQEKCLNGWKPSLKRGNKKLK